MSEANLLVFGLGNPGSKYSHTRHNIGCRVVDIVAEKSDIALKKKVSCLSICGEGMFKDSRLILAKPLTFMNESGKALKLLTQKFIPSKENSPARFKDLLIVYDDIDLPFGAIRFREKGSAGTHKGMRSCIEALGTSDFPRLRLGIRGNRGEKDLSRYVLEDFTKEEEDALPEILDKAVERAFSLL